MRNSEPVGIATAVRAVCYVVALAADVDPEVLALAVIPAVEAVALVWTRRRVSPIGKFREAGNPSIEETPGSIGVQKWRG